MIESSESNSCLEKSMIFINKSWPNSLPIKENAALLEKSEQRYRNLAENLEIEVKKKTQQIKETQSQLIQQERLRKQ